MRRGVNTETAHAPVCGKRTCIPGLGPGNYMGWPPAPFSSFPYLKKVDDAGGIKKYEKAHLARLVAMLVPKFPQLPAEIVPNIVMHWAHVGDY